MAQLSLRVLAPLTMAPSMWAMSMWAMILATEVDWRSWIVFLALGIPLIGWELKGVAARKEGDTISEGVWWLRQHFWPAWVFVVSFCFWLIPHFVLGGH